MFATIFQVAFKIHLQCFLTFAFGNISWNAYLKRPIYIEKIIVTDNIGHTLVSCATTNPTSKIGNTRSTLYPIEVIDRHVANIYMIAHVYPTRQRLHNY